jgi:hypothetical protein
VTDFRADDDMAFAVAVQPDGKLSSAVTSRSAAVPLRPVRCADGTPTVLAAGGKVTTQFQPGMPTASTPRCS